ncbi:MAG: M48 family metallopeptidase [Methanococcoides sp.]|nr:M48 family metallopeptidase [Methanococcoides sp.]
MTVKAPEGMTEDALTTNLFRRAKWIINNLDKMDEVIEYESNKEFISGEKYLLRGRRYRLKVNKGDEPSLKFLKGKFHATIPIDVPESEYKSYLQPLFLEYYHHKAEQVIDERVKKYIKYFDDEPSLIKIQDLKEKWGSCSKKNQLRFNWKIVMAKTSIIDYVVVHEMCHLRFKDHSKQYWDSIKTIMPDYEQRKEWLRVNGKLLTV